MHHFITLLALICISVSQAAEISDGQRNGQIIFSDSSQMLAWSTSETKWLTIEEFWLAHARSDERKFWGIQRVYPPFSEVRETDTFMVRTQHGNCLMEFWHTRWRRANDVRRWDPKFNDYGGCPYVFN